MSRASEVIQGPWAGGEVPSEALTLEEVAGHAGTLGLRFPSRDDVPESVPCERSGCSGERAYTDYRNRLGEYFFGGCNVCTEIAEELRAEAYRKAQEDHRRQELELERQWLAENPPWQRLGLRERQGRWSLHKAEDWRGQGRPPVHRRDDGVLYVDCDEVGQAAAWLMDFDPWEGEPGTVVLGGNHGVGKTRLALSWALDAIREHRDRVVDVFHHRLLWGLLENTYGKAADIDRTMTWLCEAEVLIWDDFAWVPGARKKGTSEAADRVCRFMDAVVDFRTRQDLSTIYTTNGTQKGLRVVCGLGTVERLREATGYERDGLWLWFKGASWRG